MTYIGLRIKRTSYNAPGHKLRFLHRQEGAICDREGIHCEGDMITNTHLPNSIFLSASEEGR